MVWEFKTDLKVPVVSLRGLLFNPFYSIFISMSRKMTSNNSFNEMQNAFKFLPASPVDLNSSLLLSIAVFPQRSLFKSMQEVKSSCFCCFSHQTMWCFVLLFPVKFSFCSMKRAMFIFLAVRFKDLCCFCISNHTIIKRFNVRATNALVKEDQSHGFYRTNEPASEQSAFF